MTVEAALSLTVIVVVLAACLAGVGCAVAQIQCVDAAREAARLAARGDDGAIAAAQRIAPSGASISVGTGGTTVTASVTVTPVGGLLPGVRLSATAVAAKEPDAAASPGALP
ncbi:TadE family type IV pilus minor pilin [Nakamurella aerolata]|uniref:Pilus assembly protein n=1 Tax=Nakamurella aerolata TaxID=1656892 RepID=A0A849A8T7_9ACTN|nr:pilus assembly protein [Nakamurella aerolata]